MSKTAYINTRIEPELKKKAEHLFAQLGLSTSDAITLFFNQSVLHKGLPFEVRIPNAETIEAINEPREGLPRFHAVQALMDDLLSDDEK